MRQLLVLPGVGSPEAPEYAPIYRFLEVEAEQRGYQARTFRYGGSGQLAQGSVEGGLSLPSAALHAKATIEDLPAGSVLVCRSFSCLVPFFLARDERLSLSNIGRLVLVAPLPYWRWWQLLISPGTQAVYAEEAARKGAVLAPKFFETLVPIESSCAAVTGLDVVIVVGQRDQHTSTAYCEYLAHLIRRDGSNKASVRSVPGAAHGVSAEDVSSVRKAYLQAIFQ